ncbi:MAG: hypothetical protein LT102_09710 [Burkholderiaceae bacterium]|nr:hypothetical protein [Burkholderiaceae bacterium]
MRTIAQAASIAGDGDVVEVEAGTYSGDVAVWRQASLAIRAVGGRVRLIADGASAEEKAIWVIRNGDFTIEGFEFAGARVPDGNGAGIRFERGRLTVRDSRFLDNQMGLLTGNDAGSRLIVERCEFSGPVDGAHWYHNLYVGLIDSLVVRESWSHSARVGHLLKSRARVNHVVDSRLVDGDGTASYELEFPNGGIARVHANLIEQSPRSSNPVIVSIGAEGYRWPVNELDMSDNTVVNRRHGAAVFVRAALGPLRATLTGNTWVGRGQLELPIEYRESGNRKVGLADHARR